ncbi:MAG: hyalin, partial [Magnetococcales bacterium]|nr:hyalin [Magnetococcales bacterium]
MATTVTLPTLSISATHSRQNEGNAGNTAMTCTVTRSGNLNQSSSVSWAVSSSSAQASDFVGMVLPSGVLHFAAHETSKTITVHVAGDTIVENSENFTV